MNNMFLITSFEDVETFKRHSNCVGFSESYPIIQANPNSSLKYFLDFDYNAVDLSKLTGELASSWYRDEYGSDMFNSDDFSIGTMLNYSLMVEFASIIRYYFAFREHSSRYRKMFLSSSSPEALKAASTPFAHKVEFYPSSGCSDHIVSAPPRGGISDPVVYRFLSMFLRTFQFPFRFFLKDKVLIFNDWTYKEIKGKKILNINKLSILKTFCLRYGSSYQKIAKSVFPKEIPRRAVELNMRRVFLKFGVASDIIDDLLDILAQAVCSKYHSSKRSLLRTYCSHKELFDVYRPSMVILPSCSRAHVQTIYSIARARKIPTVYIQDGFSIYIDKYLIPKDQKNNGYMFDYFATMSNYADDRIMSILGGEIDILKILPPVVETYSIDHNTNINTNTIAIVLFPYGALHSPYCRWDKRYKYVIEVVSLLKSLGYSNIVVKMKNGFDRYRDNENNLMRLLLNDAGCKDVEMVFGLFSDYVDKAQIVIGPMGTAILESLYREIPFYAYEPEYLGITDWFMKNSMFVDCSSVSRDIKKLKRLIQNHLPMQLDHDKVFNRGSIRNLDFGELVKNFQ